MISNHVFCGKFLTHYLIRNDYEFEVLNYLKISRNFEYELYNYLELLFIYENNRKTNFLMFSYMKSSSK